jgi:hypothetical protein
MPTDIEIPQFEQRTMLVRMCAGVQVIVHGNSPPASKDFEVYLAEIERTAAGIHGVVMYTTGGLPTPRQRRSVANVWARLGRSVPVAVVSPRLAVRMLIEGVHSVAGRDVAAFVPLEIEQALAHVGVADAQKPELASFLDGLRAELLHRRAASRAA